MFSKDADQDVETIEEPAVEEPDFLDGAEAADPESFNVCTACD